MKNQQAARLVLVGAGRMGSAFIQGWLGRKDFPYSPQSWAIINPSSGEQIIQAQKKGALVTFPVLSAEQAEHVDIVLLAVKPQKLAQAAEQMKTWLPRGACLVSVVAGVSLKALENLFPQCTLVRAMPNTPVCVGRGMTVYVVQEACSSVCEDRVRTVLAATGAVERLEKEALFDAATALSGCGPAYVFYLTEVMAAAGVREGLPQDLAEKLARLTVTGAGALLDAQKDKTPEDLRSTVASPGGATQAALDVLLQAEGLSSLIRKAMTAAKMRTQEMAFKTLP